MTALRMIWSRLIVTSQINHQRGTDLEAGSRDVKETFVAFFSESGWMRAPPAYSCRRRQSAVSLNSLDLNSGAGPFLIYAGKPRNCAIPTHCIAFQDFNFPQLYGHL